MDPISLSGAGFARPFANIRPELPGRKGLGAADTGIPQPGLDQLSSSPTQAPGGFDNILGNLVKEVNGKQMAAGDAVTGLLSGQNVPLHHAMVAMEEASVSFQLMVEVRNKLLEGYQELIRMQI
jgi:flagellar hook-basal body complex protein FliE